MKDAWQGQAAVSPQSFLLSEFYQEHSTFFPKHPSWSPQGTLPTLSTTASLPVHTLRRPGTCEFQVNLRSVRYEAEMAKNRTVGSHAHCALKNSQNEKKFPLPDTVTSLAWWWPQKFFHFHLSSPSYQVSKLGVSKRPNYEFASKFNKSAAKISPLIFIVIASIFQQFRLYI